VTVSYSDVLATLLRHVLNSQCSLYPLCFHWQCNAATHHIAQVRAMYELMKANGREIVIGGTSIITAKDYIAEIEGLSR
jgi:hypothetical protein